MRHTACRCIPTSLHVQAQNHTKYSVLCGCTLNITLWKITHLYVNTEENNLLLTACKIQIIKSSFSMYMNNMPGMYSTHLQCHTMIAGRYCTAQAVIEGAVHTLPHCFSIKHFFRYHLIPIIRRYSCCCECLSSSFT